MRAVLLFFLIDFALQQPMATASSRPPDEPLNGGMLMPASSASQPAATKAVRLIFEYDGDQVRLVSQQPVDVAVTGADLAQIDHPGFYVDTRDNQDRTLARVAARTAFAGSAEVFPEKPGESIVRVDVPRPKGAFTVVVPAAGADHVTVVHIAPGQPAAARPAGGATTPLAAQPRVTDLASFPLTPTP